MASTPALAAGEPTLAVVVLGAGSVTSQPAGIACPPTCRSGFPAGTPVVLTAKPRGGSSFVSWGGSCTGPGACTVKMTSLAAVVAEFSAGQPPAASRPVAAPGPYSGGAGIYAISFYVPPGGHNLLNVYIGSTSLNCIPSGGIESHFGMLQVPIEPNGSFSTKTSQVGIASSGAKVKITDVFSGHVEAATSTAPAGAAGTWHQSFTYASGATKSCSSNLQSWSARLYREPAGSKPLVKPGRYGGGAGIYAIGFSVAAGGQAMTDIAIPSTSLFCTPSGGVQSHFSMLEVPVKPNGSFSKTTRQSAILNGSTATITYRISGYFEALTPPRVAGLWREDIRYASGAIKSCTSDDQSWSASGP